MSSNTGRKPGNSERQTLWTIVAICVWVLVALYLALAHQTAVEARYGAAWAVVFTVATYFGLSIGPLRRTKSQIVAALGVLTGVLGQVVPIAVTGSIAAFGAGLALGAAAALRMSVRSKADVRHLHGKLLMAGDAAIVAGLIGWSFHQVASAVLLGMGVTTVVVAYILRHRIRKTSDH